ncbi:MAG: DUF1223 domain-containing protein [Nonlabens sp.]|nr:DUF1223 domain-containing protein [Nonlabens sp.]
MKNRFLLKKIVPVCCLTLAMSILVFQHKRNDKQIALPAVNQNSIVIELFTSQGCSSCPPADALVGELIHVNDVVVLSYHVDYWDRLGWKDTFSSPEHSAYQRRYTKQLHVNTYTPQIVVNGNREFVGSNKRELNAHLKSHSTVAQLESPVVKRSGNAIIADYELETVATDVQVFAILVLDEEYVTIKRGENSDKKINYHNVVIEKVPLDTTNSAGSHTFTIPLTDSKSKKYKVVLLAQDKDLKITAVSVSKSC